MLVFDMHGSEHDCECREDMDAWKTIEWLVILIDEFYKVEKHTIASNFRAWDCCLKEKIDKKTNR